MRRSTTKENGVLFVRIDAVVVCRQLGYAKALRRTDDEVDAGTGGI